MSNATLNPMLQYRYTLIKVQPSVDGLTHTIIYHAFFPDEMLTYMHLMDDFEDKKACYYLFDSVNMTIIKAANNVAERTLKRALKE